jgi:hypothetical protein
MGAPTPTQGDTTMTQHPTPTDDDTTEANAARADIAQWLERLASRVRTSTTMNMGNLEEAYTQVVTLGGSVRELLDLHPR